MAIMSFGDGKIVVDVESMENVIRYVEKFPELNNKLALHRFLKSMNWENALKYTLAAKEYFSWE